MNHAVMTGFGPCKRHARNGLTAAADHADGLCATCRSAVTAGAVRQNTYNGSKPLKADPLPKVPDPKGGTPPNSTTRKADRLARFETVLTERYGPVLDEHVPIALIREAGTAVGVGDTAAKRYFRELVPRRRTVTP